MASAHSQSSTSAIFTSTGPQGQQISSSRESHGADRSKAAVSSSQVSWKGDSEDMIRARKSAQRVILSKFRQFWPSDDDVKLTARAFDFERGEYEVGSCRMQDLERNALKGSIQFTESLMAGNDVKTRVYPKASEGSASFDWQKRI
jgi:hypothetical protein